MEILDNKKGKNNPDSMHVYRCGPEAAGVVFYI